uniref:Fe-S cluster assembly accessory protein n=1 Tax=uncultured Chloroflexota bacterium TaxID=166587 RepID=H5SK69_9CHLR|nr:iron-sulfur cluster assembly accessory protein [uncultured bacterium]BAL56555.1 Fe-S cluster assembly accessory protein [uncultured Chloroflexota bacterium]
MLTQIETPLTLTPQAAQAIQNILTERKLDGYALRVYVAGGCCSVQFGMALDNVVRETDRVFHCENIPIVVDDITLEYLQGATIDFVHDPQHGEGFVIHSPATAAHSHAEGDCACGGACSC